MSILEILEAHQIGYVYADIHGLRKQGCTGCDFRIEGQASEIGNMREIHRTHVAQVLKQHEREREAAAVREAGQYISLLHRGGLVDHRGVLADIEIAADRIGRGFHAGGRDKEPRDGRE